MTEQKLELEEEGEEEEEEALGWACDIIRVERARRGRCSAMASCSVDKPAYLIIDLSFRHSKSGRSRVCPEMDLSFPNRPSPYRIARFERTDAVHSGTRPAHLSGQIVED
jgi:hypothetical protein